MIIIRIFLYLICVISIGWSLLVFGGPPIIKRLISGYSDGAVVPSGITVSPRLDIGISQLEFKIHNEIAGQKIEGFSRAAEIAWSLFGEKPFLEISLGPSVVKGYATADSVEFYTQSFKTIDWKNIAVVANIESLVANPFANMHSVTLDGILNLKALKISNVNIGAEELSAIVGDSRYTAGSLKTFFSELSLNGNLAEQLLSATFTIEDIKTSEPNFTAPRAIMEFLVTEAAKDLKINLHDVSLSEFGGYIKHLIVDGSFTQSNVLQELQIVSADGFFSKKLPKFHEISATVKRSDHEQYQVSIKGSLKEFEMSNSDNFIGLLPASNFVIESEVDREVAKMNATSKFNFTTLSSTDISGYIEMGFSSELLRYLECSFLDCELSDINFLYEINIDQEWVKGSAYCLRSFCDLSEMEYLIRTSNTASIFTILNKDKILSPLSSLYLYGVISSGKKINGGHELKL